MRFTQLHFLRFSLASLIILSTLFASLQTHAQSLNTVLYQFWQNNESVPAEKVYLHLDKTQYVQGETIWAKAYLVAGPDHRPSKISRNLHVELISAEGKSVKHLILDTNEGLAHTDIPLAKELPEGDYYLRAYTNWMKNHGPEFFFNKKIKIYDINRIASMPSTEISQSLDLQFYPEGGHLVKNLASRLAFQVTGDQPGKETLSGIIFNSQDQPVANFSTAHEGRGMISFVPKDLNHYAIVDGSDKRFEVPSAKELGLVMLVNNREEEELIVTVKSSDEDRKNLYLIVHTRGEITFATELLFKGDRSINKIEKSILPAGISHFTVLNAQQQPLSERLAFIPPTDQIKLELKTNKSNYGTRELVTVGIKVTDEKGKPVKGSFSLSAYNSELIANDQADYNIQTHLLLSSDIKGHVNQPAQYFEETLEAGQHLDLLMMVNGWRRFSWEEITSENYTALYPPEQGLNITGRLLREGKDQIKNGTLFLMNGANGKGLMASTSENGFFTFENQEYYDTTQLVFQGFHKSGFKNVSLEIDTTFEQIPLFTYKSPKIEVDEQQLEAFKKQARSFVSVQGVIERRNGVTDLGVVTVESDKPYARDARLGTISNKLDFTEIPFTERKKRDTYSLLMGRIPGFTFAFTTGTGGNSDPYFRSPRMGFGNRWTSPPLVMIDGIVVDPIEVYDINPTTIDYVVTGREFPGFISIYTMSPEKYARVTPKPGMFIEQLDGYHVPKEFYAPKHDGSNPYKGLSDNRTTLFWAPMITTDENGEAMIKFYTPDDRSYVTIDVQGLTFNGKAGAGRSGFNIITNL